MAFCIDLKDHLNSDLCNPVGKSLLYNCLCSCARLSPNNEKLDSSWKILALNINNRDPNVWSSYHVLME